MTNLNTLAMRSHASMFVFPPWTQPCSSACSLPGPVFQPSFQTQSRRRTRRTTMRTLWRASRKVSKGEQLNGFCAEQLLEHTPNTTSPPLPPSSAHMEAWRGKSCVCTLRRGTLDAQERQLLPLFLICHHATTRVVASGTQHNVAQPRDPQSEGMI